MKSWLLYHLKVIDAIFSESEVWRADKLSHQVLGLLRHFVFQVRGEVKTILKKEGKYSENLYLIPENHIRESLLNAFHRAQWQNSVSTLKYKDPAIITSIVKSTYFAEKTHLVIHDFPVGFHETLCIEGRLPIEHFVHAHAEGPPVALSAVAALSVFHRLASKQTLKRKSRKQLHGELSKASLGSQFNQRNIRLETFSTYSIEKNPRKIQNPYSIEKI